jgi:hypothetical protein
MRQHREDETQLLQPESATLVVARCIADFTGRYKPKVVKTMLGHMRRIIAIFDYQHQYGLLALLSRSLGKGAPTATRRYDTIWDINCLLQWIRQDWPDNAVLCDVDLQTKAMLLIMIFSACRLAELARMERPSEEHTAEGVMALFTVTKQFQEEKRRIVIRKVSTPSLCPVSTTKAWMERSKGREREWLFYRQVDQKWSTATICTQFLRAMRAAGIPDHFTAYSVKHAVVTKLFKLGATEEQVNAYGGWAQGSRTARRWYDIATMEEEWLGARLVGEWFGKDPDRALEDVLQECLPTTQTPQEAGQRTRVVETMMSSTRRPGPAPAGAPEFSPSEPDPARQAGRQLKCGKRGRSGGDQ